MTAGDVFRKLREHGARETRRKGSHRRFVSSCQQCKTTVPDHGHRDLGTGLIKAIDADMAPCWGKGWLK